MSKMVLIIGTGTAALTALEKFRDINAEDEVKLVTREKTRPYSPATLPFLLSRRIEEKHIWLKDASYFNQLNCTFETEKEVAKVFPHEKRVIYQDQTEDTYDRLLIASGASPAVKKIEGLLEGDYITFRTFQDYQRIQQILKARNPSETSQFIIFGGGLVAAELAVHLLDAGYAVTLIVRSRLLRSYVNRRMSDRIEDILVNKGAAIHKGCHIESVNKRTDGMEVKLSDSQILFSDIDILLALGVKPNVSFLEGSGIDINEGIVVDSGMRTNIEHIFAAGDVTESSCFFDGEKKICGILPTAVRQGEVAGINMAGGDSTYTGWISMNVFRFFDHVACSIGQSGDDSETFFAYENNKEDQFKELSIRDGKLVGARFLDVKVDPGVFLYLIENQVPVEPHKALLLKKPRETSRWLMLEAEKAQTRV